MSITHDLATVRLIADRIVVLYLGSVMESGPASEVFASPQHPYTQALFSAQLTTRPENRRRRYLLSGEIPSPVDMPPGCPFSGRCPLVIDTCRAQKPALETWQHSEVACIRVRTGDNKIPGIAPWAGGRHELHSVPE